MSYYLKHLVVVSLDQRQLETVLGGVNGKHPGLRLPVEAVQTLRLDPGKVDGLFAA